jgi:hypothetical protein
MKINHGSNNVSFRFNGASISVVLPTQEPMSFPFVANFEIVAHWNDIPYRTYSGGTTVRPGIVAYSANGIESVKFFMDTGDGSGPILVGTATEMTSNPDTQATRLTDNVTYTEEDYHVDITLPTPAGNTEADDIDVLISAVVRSYDGTEYTMNQEDVADNLAAINTTASGHALPVYVSNQPVNEVYLSPTGTAEGAGTVDNPLPSDLDIIRYWPSIAEGGGAVSSNKRYKFILQPGTYRANNAIGYPLNSVKTKHYSEVVGNGASNSDVVLAGVDDPSKYNSGAFRLETSDYRFIFRDLTVDYHDARGDGTEFTDVNEDGILEVNYYFRGSSSRKIFTWFDNCHFTAAKTYNNDPGEGKQYAFYGRDPTTIQRNGVDIVGDFDMVDPALFINDTIYVYKTNTSAHMARSKPFAGALARNCKASTMWEDATGSCNLELTTHYENLSLAARPEGHYIDIHGDLWQGLNPNGTYGNMIVRNLSHGFIYGQGFFASGNTNLFRRIVFKDCNLNISDDHPIASESNGFVDQIYFDEEGTLTRALAQDRTNFFIDINIYERCSSVWVVDCSMDGTNDPNSILFTPAEDAPLDNSTLVFEDLGYSDGTLEVLNQHYSGFIANLVGFGIPGSAIVAQRPLDLSQAYSVFTDGGPGPVDDDYIIALINTSSGAASQYPTGLIYRTKHGGSIRER